MVSGSGTTDGTGGGTGDGERIISQYHTAAAAIVPCSIWMVEELAANAMDDRTGPMMIGWRSRGSNGGLRTLLLLLLLLLHDEADGDGADPGPSPRRRRR